MKFVAHVAIAASLCFVSLISAADDILMADFEADTYGDWQATGDAFGDGPAKGTLGGLELPTKS
ncbi:MAG: hypothetical protein WBD31_09520 [Rubripirellula sp.]